MLRNNGNEREIEVNIRWKNERRREINLGSNKEEREEEINKEGYKERKKSHRYNVSNFVFEVGICTGVLISP